MNRVIIGVSGNIEPERHIPAAIQRLARIVHVVSQGPVLETAPIGRPEQAVYWNTAVLAQTPMGATALKRRLRRLETEFGRVRTEDRYAARTLDLDELWRNEVVQVPEVQERPFLQQLVAQLTGMTEPPHVNASHRTTN